MSTNLKISSFLMGALGLLASASARADDCAIPAFNAAQHTYLSATLQQDSALRAQLDGLSDELVTAGNANGHQIIPYFVACQKDYQDGVPGVVLSRDIFDTWRSDNSFPWQSRVIVITWVRNGLDTRHGSIGANAGKPLADMGFTGDYFASDNGPVLRDIRRFMPADPKGEFVKIVRLVDVSMDEAIAGNDPIKQGREERGQSHSTPPENILMAVLFLAWMLYMCFQLNNTGEDEKTYARRFIREKGRDTFNRLHQADADLKAMTNFVPLPRALSNEASTLRAKLVSIGDTNPVESAKTLKAVAGEAERLGNTVKEALLLLERRVPEMENGLAAARASLADQRAKVVVFAFPEAATDSQEVLFKLAEEGENPEEQILHAEEAFADAKRLLDEGKVAEAKGKFEDAYNSMERAKSLSERTLAAKTGTEEIVPSIRQARLELLDACEKGVEPLEQLKSSEFAPVNYEDVADSVEVGRKIAVGVDAVIATAAKLYFEQNFLAAKSTLDQLLENLNTARTQAERLPLKLAELRTMRETVVQNLATVKEKMNALGQKLEQKGKAAAKYQGDYDRLRSQYEELSQASSSNGLVLINWLMIYTLYESITAQTTSVSQQMDFGRSSYESGGYRSSSDGGMSSGGLSISMGGAASYGGDSFSGGAGGGNY